MDQYLTKEAFSENLDTTFRARVDPPHELSLKLFEITDGINNERQEQFALHFYGPLNVQFRQGLMTLDHDSMGAIELFLVAVGQRPEGVVYEAVFNRLRKDES
jgi:hypothetical protein